MNVLQFSSSLEERFRQHMASGANEPYHCQTTWCSDLAIALWYEPENTNSIINTVEECKRQWPTSFAHILECCAACNFLCWFCFETKQFPQFIKYWKTFSKLYYELLDFASTHLQESDYLRMVRILD